MSRLARNQKSEIRSQKSEDRGQRAEDRPLTSGVHMLALVLLAIIFFGGCGRVGREAGEERAGEVGLTPAEQRKAELLEQIERRFERPKAHFELGRLYQADGLWEEAEYEYNIALRFMPGHRGAQAALVKLMLERGDTTKAGLYADIYVNQAGSSAHNSVVLGRAFQERGLDDYAQACYQQALRLAPNSAGVHKQVGYYYLSRNDKARALEYLKRSFQLDPYQPEVAGELGRLGVVIKIPQKTRKDTKKLDKVLQSPE